MRKHCFSSSIPFVDLSWQHQQLQSDIQSAIATLLDQGDFIMGKGVRDFEAAFAKASGANYGIGVGCGTDAIAVGLASCGIGPGDEVILPVNTFVATLIGIIRSGATPVFVDCDPNTALIDLQAAEAAITATTRGLVPVHLYGQMVSPKALLDIAQKHNLIIFEDAAQAHLAQREGYRAGSIGAAAAFSFYPSKNLGGIGDGGMLLTQQKSIAEAARSLQNYGASSKYTYIREGGTNSRLDTLQAVVLNLKLPRLSDWNRVRWRIAQHYNEQLAPLRGRGIHPILNHSGTGHVYHLFVIRVSQDCPINRTALQQILQECSIQTGIHYPVPCHLQPAFRSMGHQPGDFPHAEVLSQEILSLPMHPGMTLDQVEQVVSAIAKAINLK